MATKQRKPEPDGPRRLGPGRILAELGATGPRGEQGDGLVEIHPDDPRYPIWDAWLAERGK